MTIETYSTAAHTVNLDPMLGIGTLTLPSPVDDIRLPASVLTDDAGGQTVAAVAHTSLHDADWNSTLRTLVQAGWEPLEDEDGGFVHIGYDVEMREVIALSADEPIVSDPPLDEMHAGWMRLHEAARIVLPS